MDALEKGKSTSRGGKLSDTMVSGSQFIKKKQSNTTISNMPNFALGGMEGISFNLLKKGNRGKMEAKQFYVPKDTNLAVRGRKCSLRRKCLFGARKASSYSESTTIYG